MNPGFLKIQREKTEFLTKCLFETKAIYRNWEKVETHCWRKTFVSIKNEQLNVMTKQKYKKIYIFPDGLLILPVPISTTLWPVIAIPGIKHLKGWLAEFYGILNLQELLMINYESQNFWIVNLGINLMQTYGII